MSQNRTDFRAGFIGCPTDTSLKATERFAASARLAKIQAQRERVSLLAGELVKAANDIIVEHEVTGDEFNALKSWLIKVGKDGEWPLILDIWLGSSVVDSESQENRARTISAVGSHGVPADGACAQLISVAGWNEHFSESLG